MGLPARAGLDNRGPSPLVMVRAQVEEARPTLVSGQSPMKGPDAGISLFWVKDGLRRLSEEETQSEGISKTDCALLEEVARYENASFSFGMVVSTPPFSPSSIYGRTPLGEYYDLSRATLDITQGVTHRLCNGSGSIEQEEGKCWELIEVNTDSIEESRETLCLARPMPQEERGWEEVSWEESDLARFSKFLGFSTEGLEKDILEFLVKIRKRRERVHSKVLLEKSRFERELKRLECSINYGGEEEEVCCARKRMPDYGSPMKIRLLSWNVRGANDSSKRKVIKVMIKSQKVDLFCVQETKIQSMTEGSVRSLGSGRFLDWGAMGA